MLRIFVNVECVGGNMALLLRKMATPQTISERLRSLRKRAGLSMDVLAREAGYRGASSLQRYENSDEFTKERLPIDLVERIAPILIGHGNPPITHDDVYGLAGIALKNDEIPLKSETIAPIKAGENARVMQGKPEFGQRDLPVRGVAAAGTDALFITNGEPHDWALRPPALMGVTDAYAVITAGDSMEPRYLDGEAVYVHPGRRVTRGPHIYVVVQLHPDEEGEAPVALVKKYERQTAKELVLSQYNPPKELRFAIKTVKSIHLIINPLDIR